MASAALPEVRKNLNGQNDHLLGTVSVNREGKANEETEGHINRFETSSSHRRKHSDKDIDLGSQGGVANHQAFGKPEDEPQNLNIDLTTVLEDTKSHSKGLGGSLRLSY